MNVVNGDGAIDEVKLGWGERALRVRGVVMLVVMGLFASFGSLLWINYQGFMTLSAQIAAASEEHKKIDAWMESVVYVLTLSDAQRQTIRLQMPEKIREMEIRNTERRR